MRGVCWAVFKVVGALRGPWMGGPVTVSGHCVDGVERWLEVTWAVYGWAFNNDWV